MNKKQLTLIGYACGIAAGDQGCADGPEVFKQENKLEIPVAWQKMLYPQSKISLPAVAELSKQLAQLTYGLAQEKAPFVVLGGDHSSAIGTWSGVAAAVEPQGSLGLIWIDAHMDSHTPETSESGRIHGMPAACLLGYGAPELINILSTHPKVKPENFCLIGIRSYEAGEADLIKKLGIRVYFMEEIHNRGLEIIMQEAVQQVSQNTIGYGVTIDLDSMDPIEVPGVGSPEPDGLSSLELCKSLANIVKYDKKLLGLEIAEFNPHHDHTAKTIRIMEQLIQAVY